ncbi:MAG: LCP family protein [Clostridiales bacterium]|nr:LCP family protein [Clostridiales bacterium]
MKRILAVLLLFPLLLTSAQAATPDPIFALDYDSLESPPAGVHHYLLACFDTWDFDEDYQGNTDGLLLVTLDTVQRRVIFTSIMREILIRRPDGGIGRITYITKNYGPEALCEIVSTHFGVKVDKYLFFNMDNIQKMIDALGGVYITVTDAEAYYLNRYRISRDSTTPSMDMGGTYLFSGHAAVIYMRIRKVGGDGDVGRTRRVRTVLSTLVAENQDITLSEAVGLAYALTENVCMTNMTMNDLMTAVASAYALRGIEAEGFQLPTSESMEPITYVGMMTNQVDYALCRLKFLAFMAGEQTAEGNEE